MDPEDNGNTYLNHDDVQIISETTLSTEGRYSPPKNFEVFDKYLRRGNLNRVEQTQEKAFERGV